MWNNLLRKLWNISLRSMWNEINPTHVRRRISHGEAIFHARSAFHKSLAGFISLKKALAFASAFFWSRLWDSNPQPADYKSAALPIELSRQIWRPGWGSNSRPPAWQAGVLTNWTTGPLVLHRRLELRTPWLKVKCSTAWANGSYWLG